MEKVETEEFSVIRGQYFEAVTVVAGAISFKREPEELFSPQMSVWTSDPDEAMSPSERLSTTLQHYDPSQIERRAVTFGGMSGEFSRIDDQLKDYETDESRPWYRLRVLLVSSDGSTWYHATAMAGDQDLPLVQAELDRALHSITVKVTGERAVEVRAKARDEMNAVYARMAEQARADRERIDAGGSVTAKVAPPAKDVEATFDTAVAFAGVTDKREALRRIAMPTLTLIEAGRSDPDLVGRSRVGGGPDLPEGAEWPRDASGFHLNFLAQIDLTDLPDLCEDLPSSGLLSFFSGTDLTDGTVFFTPSVKPLVAHELREDVEEISIAAMRMVCWDGDAGRLVPETTEDGDLSIVSDPFGRMTFLRKGEPVIVLASEYEISRSRQSLRFGRSLTVPFGIPDTVPEAYLEAGLEDPADFCIALADAFKLGDGPQQQMFGVTGVRELSAHQQNAVDHARRSGRQDLTSPSDWFILFKIASGGEAGFSFSDHGDFIFMANRQATRKGDFSHVYAFVESG
ncbi:DUF1963 domain-containing protein [Jiella mangrovi]|uniref:DUF1963 domain-containing protein n=1 Tax=Jiella mangrovi TaxID=2821407 RepID=A0ABS4BBI7_9HYPH|nr:DUF1963 domain-containing protein [Jiella mangrovi]MBP0614118.1 DUF1963 domain-containing protein [Jiella mangrovi]